jgi:hypothetical protein
MRLLSTYSQQTVRLCENTIHFLSCVCKQTSPGGKQASGMLCRLFRQRCTALVPPTEREAAVREQTPLDNDLEWHFLFQAKILQR